MVGEMLQMLEMIHPRKTLNVTQIYYKLPSVTFDVGLHAPSTRFVSGNIIPSCGIHAWFTLTKPCQSYQNLCQTISRTATCWSRIFLECGLALNPPQIPSSQWCTATQKELCPATLWWLTPRSPSESWMHLEMRFSTGKHTHTHTFSIGDKCDALMADAVICFGAVRPENTKQCTEVKYVRVEGSEEKERVWVQVRIHTRALHSCVIEFPSALWPGFFLQMASCAWLHVCVCILACARQPVRQQVVFAGSSSQKKEKCQNLFTVSSLCRDRRHADCQRGVWGGVQSKDHC